MSDTIVQPAPSHWRRLTAKAFAPTMLVAGTVILLNLIRMISSMVLTRLLDVEIFGVVGVLTSIAIVFTMISDLGFVAYVVRSHEGVDKRFLDEIWTLRLIRSASLSAILAACAWPIAAYVGQPALAPAIAVFGICFLFDGLTSMAVATSERSGRIARISLFDVLTTITQTILTIAFAWALRSYWAMIYGMLLGNTIKVVLSYAMFPDSARRWRFSAARAAELWRFSRYITGSSILTMIITQSDKIALSRFLPLNLFGLYVIATTLAQAPTAFTSAYANRVLYPIYARIVREQAGALQSRYYAERRRISLLYALAAGGLVTMAPVVIELLYDPRYRGASLYLQILAIGSIPALNTQAANAALIAAGRMWTTLISNIVRLGWLIAAGTAGYLTFGPTGLILAVGTVEIAAQAYYWFALGQARLLALREEGLMIGTAVAGAAIGKAVAMVALNFIH
ncbi:oligosaccharide flippase family protein [Sphingomonas sp. KC8]|uniref:oligosaccharide flippase family protein n=1 Tax=Sphingomonas sp. KC8 TaxID=1030157 RepID=UPI001110D046|nr:oligosaccharide flippase family protein [Sphingomonas sp. KC8]